MHLIGMPGGMEIFVILFIFSIPAIFWAVALIDCLRSDFAGNNKIAWILIIIFLPILGSILYFLMGRSQKAN